MKRVKRETELDGKKVWLVFQWKKDGHLFQGVFASRSRAVKACSTDTHCVCPATIGAELGPEIETWPGAWYPYRERQRNALDNALKEKRR